MDNTGFTPGLILGAIVMFMLAGFIGAGIIANVKEQCTINTRVPITPTLKIECKETCDTTYVYSRK